MKRKLLLAELAAGLILLAGGLLFHSLNLFQQLSVPRPELAVIGTSLIGTLLIISSCCDLFTKKTRQEIIEEQDERNISISNAAMAMGYRVLSAALGISVFAFIFLGYMNELLCFTFLGILLLGGVVWRICLYRLQKHM